MWLLRRELSEELTRKFKLYDNIELAIPKESRDAFYASFGASHSAISAGPSLPRNSSVAGDTLEIRVEGILTAKPDIFAWFFGGGNCTYESIQQALAYASADPTIKKIVWKIASGGGRLTGLFECLAAIEATTKPMTVIASEACSAAYAIASLAAKNGKIESTTPASEFGCIGVAMDMCFDNDETLISITNTESPDKRPDPKTPEGQAKIRVELDAVHQLFVEAIARGRHTDVKTVNSTYGRGAVCLAGQAKKLGMIDKVAKVVSMDPPIDTTDPFQDEDEQRKCASTAQIGDVATVTPPISALHQLPAEPQAQQQPPGPEPITKKVSKMDLATLQAQHPDLYKQIVDSTLSNERDRVNAHLEMGKASGAMDVALDAVVSGSTMTQTLQAKYLAAGMNKSSQAARQGDDAVVAGVLAGATTAAARALDMGDLVVALMKKEQTGVVLLPAMASR
jgi:Periplasmic serine proteases (ClpP class)